MTALTEHFSLEDMTRSQTACLLGIDNRPSPSVLLNLRRLARFLELVRLELGGVPILISSGYRNAALNQAVGGVRNSAHLSGLAADFTAPGFGTPAAICLKLKQSFLSFDQLIYEFPRGAKWVHLGIAPEDGTPRREILTIDKKGTRAGLWT